MRPMTNDVDVLRKMLHDTGDLRLIKVIRKAKRYMRNAKKRKKMDLQ